MDWTKFNNHGESNNHAFEVMCNILFETWCKKEYQEELKYFSFVKPIVCPKCHKPYKVDVFKRCVHCGAYLGGIMW